MITEEVNYDFTPITQSTPIAANTKVISNSGSDSSNSNQQMDNVNHQAQENSKYDQEMPEVKPMYGGNINSYIINYKKKKYNVFGKNKEKVLQTFIKNKNIIHDEMIEIYLEKNLKKSKSIYVIKNILNNKKINLMKII